MLTDFRLAFRRLAKTPTFTIIAGLTLALGLGANISVFGIINEFMLRPLKVPNPAGLVFLLQKNPKFEIPYGFSYPDFRDLRASLSGAEADGGERPFSDVLAEAMFPVHLSESGQQPERAWVHAVSENYFDLLGVRAVHGRLLLPGEGVDAGADPILVLAHRFWTEHFNADPRIVGQSINLNGVSFTIVGVAPAGFGGTESMVQAQMFTPVSMWRVLQPGNPDGLENRGNTVFLLMARLNPGVTTQQATAALETALARLIADHPDSHAPSTARIIPEQVSRPSPHVSGFVPFALVALMILAGLVLAVAAANVANLLYARAAEAERMLAIRSALGASRWRLIRFLLAESTLLALFAGVLGWFAADVFGLALTRIQTSADLPPPAQPDQNWVPFAFTLAAALATGLLTGLFPALRATRRDMLPLLSESGRSVSGGRHPLRSLLVCGQIALSCVVLVCAGLAARSLQRLSTVDLGFRPENVLMAGFDLELQHYDRARAEQLQKTLLDEIRALPGVKSAAIARAAPLEPRNVTLRGGLGAEGQPPPDRDDLYLIATAQAGPDWLATIDMPLIAGREFTEHDRADTQHVGVVSQTLAEHFWPREDPLGKRLAANGGQRLIEIVGVVGDARYFMMSDQNRPFLFVPLAQEPAIDFTLAVRTVQDPRGLAQTLLQIVQRLDPNLPVQNIRTLEEQVAQSPLGLMPLRLGAMIATTQGALVLLLAVMGLYGLVSFAVACRTREIGIRVALGATRRDILRLVARPSLVLTGIGLVVGLGLAFLVTRPLGSLLYGVSPNDAFVYGGVIVLIALVTVFASWLPARRATRVSPTEALRAE